MRYVANQPLVVIPPGTEDRQEFAPGDTLADFASWPHQVQQALLSTNKVKLDLDPSQWVHKDDADGLRAALDALAKKPAADAPSRSKAPAPPTESPDGDPSDASDAVSDAEMLPCELCTKSFKGHRALASHRGKAHGGL